MYTYVCTHTTYLYIYIMIYLCMYKLCVCVHKKCIFANLNVPSNQDVWSGPTAFISMFPKSHANHDIWHTIYMDAIEYG